MEQAPNRPHRLDAEVRRRLPGRHFAVGVDRQVDSGKEGEPLARRPAGECGLGRSHPAGVESHDVEVVQHLVAGAVALPARLVPHQTAGDVGAGSGLGKERPHGGNEIVGITITVCDDASPFRWA